MRGFKAIFAGWRGLGLFWAALITLCIAGALTVQGLGPPAGFRTSTAAAPDQPADTGPMQAPAAPQMPVSEPGAAAKRAEPAAPPPERPGRDTPGPVNDPDPALLEPLPGSTTETLPRMAPDGRKSMNVYAAGFDPTNLRPRVAVLMASFGQIPLDTKRAITDLPAGVSFAVSPYSHNLDALLTSARLQGHEYFLSLPMEPTGFPNTDPGPRALLTNLSPAQNLPRLQWILSRLNGYVGTAAVLGSMRGERFIDQPEQLLPVLRELGQRGLPYIDPRPGAGPLPGTWTRSIDIVIDEPATATDIEARLASLEALARDRGAALGLVTAPRPVAIERLIAWTNGLANRGIALAPVSALLNPPARGTETAR